MLTVHYNITFISLQIYNNLAYMYLSNCVLRCDRQNFTEDNCA